MNFEAGRAIRDESMKLDGRKCEHCQDSPHAKIVIAKWPDRDAFVCHACGRELRSSSGAEAAEQLSLDGDKQDSE